jgi:hypothetical protein
MSKYKEPRIRWQFTNEEELVDYIANLFDIEPLSSSSIRGTGSQVRNRRGVRASKDRPALFNNPVLDHITSPHGEIVIGSQSFNLQARRLGATSRGFVRLEPPTNRFTAFQALSCYTDFTGLENCVSDDGRLRTYSDGMASISFKSYKDSTWKYWEMGTEIKASGGNFEAAVINSRYYGQAYGQTCMIQDYDDDSDTNDNYLEESEWGIFAPQPIRVESLCRVQWNGRRISGVVSAGGDCFVVSSVVPWPEGWPEDWPPLDTPPAGSLAIRPTSLSFTSRPSRPSSTKSITITSSFPGPVSVTVEDAIVTTPPTDPSPIGRPSFGGEPIGEFSNLSGQFNIQPNTSLQIPVTFTGESGLGSITGSLRIVWDQGQVRIGLLGTLVEELAFTPI